MKIAYGKLAIHSMAAPPKHPIFEYERDEESRLPGDGDHPGDKATLCEAGPFWKAAETLRSERGIVLVSGCE